MKTSEGIKLCDESHHICRYLSTMESSVMCNVAEEEDCYVRKYLLAEQRLQRAIEDAERYRQEANGVVELAQKNLNMYIEAKDEIQILKSNRLNMFEQMDIVKDNKLMKDVLNAIANGRHFAEDVVGHLKELAQQTLDSIEGEQQ